MTTTVRRTRLDVRLDVRLGRWLTVDQIYRHRESGDLWRVRQIHRADCELELTPTYDSCQRICITFTELRLDWVWIAYTPRPEAPTA